MTCFCKLVVHKVIPAKYLVAVVINYTRFFDKFGDIIKVKDNFFDWLIPIDLGCSRSGEGYGSWVMRTSSADVCGGVCGQG